MPILTDLDISWNSLNGSIPLSMGNLQALMTLVISNNHLSGEIPQFWNKMPSHVYCRYVKQQPFRYNTKITGFPHDTQILGAIQQQSLWRNHAIPVDFSLAVQLLQWNLSGFKSELSDDDIARNNLGGTIPEKIGNLQWLETLDLSRNKLSGPIPMSMASITFLAHLNLSHNNLSGKIPTGNQLQTLIDPSIYQGNLALCGFPLTNECHDNNGTNPTGKGEDKDDEDGDDSELHGSLLAWDWDSS
ncbi:putative inactive leucine-rich repeat receptor kinase XIAO [Vitis vinifera]|uniref:Putative inactive leucine-rich repeat receptor kinase XIAO n=1 Tax=Vitis vinifera TaxID=29760 RepID=A0A438H7I6_VITVI|nr:putative inactive leucine-rich repeat receptor kinase XIAO [Vitis vinifera]